jgi:phage baseplate assembly protein W
VSRANGATEDRAMTRLSDITAAHWQPALGSPDTIVTGLADIQQAIAIILRTPKGADPHRPAFGSNLRDYLDWPVEQAIPHVVRESVEAIRRWEPRVDVVSVTPTIDGAHLTLRVVFLLADGVEAQTQVVVA